MYYWNNKAITEKILTEILASSSVTLTLLRMPYIIGPCNRATIPGFRKDAALFPGRNPRTQFVHENDVAQAFAQAIRTDMPGAFNVVPDDYIRLSDVYNVMGAKPITVPVWLAKLITTIRWRFLGSPTHPSWVQATLVDFTASNTKLKAKGWRPHFNCAEAIRTALETKI
jgi:nucleoside-diphosphate-sugar epimerase